MLSGVCVEFINCRFENALCVRILLFSHIWCTTPFELLVYSVPELIITVISKEKASHSISTNQIGYDNVLNVCSL